jgi:hypothetical protein
MTYGAVRCPNVRSVPLRVGNSGQDLGVLMAGLPSAGAAARLEQDDLRLVGE